MRGRTFLVTHGCGRYEWEKILEPPYVGSYINW